MENRKCKMCGEIKPLLEFANAGIVNGISYKRHKCSSCYSNFKTEKANNKMDAFREYKKTLKCQRCGFSDYRALQFHHKDDNKEGTISEMARSYSWKNLLIEIQKREVLCANCHQIHHFDERSIA